MHELAFRPNSTACLKKLPEKKSRGATAFYPFGQWSDDHDLTLLDDIAQIAFPRRPAAARAFRGMTQLPRALGEME